MQSIITKYIGPTNHRGARIKASATGGGGSITISYDHELRTEECHAKAAKALCAKLDWHGTLVSGGLKTGCVFVFLNDQDQIEV